MLLLQFSDCGVQSGSAESTRQSLSLSISSVQFVSVPVMQLPPQSVPVSVPF